MRDEGNFCNLTHSSSYLDRRAIKSIADPNIYCQCTPLYMLSLSFLYMYKLCVKLYIIFVIDGFL